MTRLPLGYWEDFSNLEAELNPIIEELGHFPSRSELNEFGRSSIPGAIHKYHGGVNAVRERMGYEIEIKSKGYWEDFSNLEAELNPIIEELGYFPSIDDLKDGGKSSIINAIYRYHDGINIVRERMGYEAQRRHNGYMKEFSDLEFELDPIIEELGHFPSQIELRGMGKSSLTNAMFKHHGGMGAVSKLMGHKLKKRNCYWEDFSNLEAELNPIIEELGHFPTVGDLKDGMKSSIINAIHKYHGGINAVREKMGQCILKNSKGHWEDFSNLEAELNPIIEKLGHFPTWKEFGEMGKGYVYTAMIRHHGIGNVREKMGHLSKKDEELKELECIVREYLEND